MSDARRAIILVLDGVGCGEAPDAAAYGDAGSDTLGNIARAVGGLKLPNLEQLGLGRIRHFDGIAPVEHSLGAWGLMQPRSTGKDSTTGHWEIAGVLLERAFRTWPDGFSQDVIDRFARATGRGVIGNVAGSGTDIMARYAEEHQRTGAWIVYTSADSVFQVAAHEETVPLDELYESCEQALALLQGAEGGPLVSRVIARPFTGRPGGYVRTANRRDFSVPPPQETLLDALAAADVPRSGVGKVDDLFARRNILARHTRSNAEGLAEILAWLEDAPVGLLLANLVDFDQQFGHRNDVSGFNRALREFDAALPELLSRLRPQDILFLTADHGNDPTTSSTDHARENVPLLVAGPPVRPRSVGVRDTFADLGATAADWFGIGFRGAGESFLPQVTAT